MHLHSHIFQIEVIIIRSMLFYTEPFLLHSILRFSVLEAHKYSSSYPFAFQRMIGLYVLTKINKHCMRQKMFISGNYVSLCVCACVCAVSACVCVGLCACACVYVCTVTITPKIMVQST